jgi:hypothetical protein
MPAPKLKSLVEGARIATQGVAGQATGRVRSAYLSIMDSLIDVLFLIRSYRDDSTL